MVKVKPKDSRGSRCLKDMIMPHELSPQSQPQTDDTEILPQTQATTPSELVQSESTVKVEEADELLMETGATETGLQPSQSSDRLVSLSGAPESNELQMEPDSTRTEPHDVSHSDHQLSLSLAQVHVAVVLWTLGCQGLQLPVIQTHVAVVLWTLVSVWAQRRNERRGQTRTQGRTQGKTHMI